MEYIIAKAVFDIETESFPHQHTGGRTPDPGLGCNKLCLSLPLRGQGKPSSPWGHCTCQLFPPERQQKRKVNHKSIQQNTIASKTH